MCELAAADGTTHIVATPHCNHRYPFDRLLAQDKIDELRIRFTRLEFSLGCEMSLSEDNMAQVVKHPELFTVGGTSYILVEVVDAYMPNRVEDALGELISLGLVPILAHPERNSLMRRRQDLLKNWVAMGCLAAITGNSLTGSWGTETRKIAEKMLRDSLAHFLVSDGHDPSVRPPMLSEALKAATKLVGSKQAHELVWANPLSAVRDQAILV